MKAVRQRKPARLVVMPAAAVILEELDGPGHPGVDRMVGGFEGEDEQALLVGVDAVGAGLVVVDDAQVRGVEPGLADGANGPRRGEKIGEAEHGVGAEARPALAAASRPR